MKALRFSKLTPWVLAIGEISKPQPGEGEAHVHVRASAINPSIKTLNSVIARDPRSAQ
jgi:NADPH:quinone reductase-like Zn-dependent oxidoreductase